MLLNTKNRHNYLVERASELACSNHPFNSMPLTFTGALSIIVIIIMYLYALGVQGGFRVAIITVKIAPN